VNKNTNKPNFELAERIALNVATGYEIELALDMTDLRERAKMGKGRVGAHDALSEALKSHFGTRSVGGARVKNQIEKARKAEVQAILRSATAAEAAKPTKLDEVRTIARALRAEGKIERGACGRVINVADRILAEHPGYGAKRAVNEAIGMYRGLAVIK
jgi:hypothetical protein